MATLTIETPRWLVPFLQPARYKGAKGGRSSGKSHGFAEMLVEEHIHNKDLQSVCVREIQKSLKFSAKKLIEDKIRAFGVSHLFDVTLTEIKRVGGSGIIIFQGMQDHTADSIKSLEGFDRAWVEEAQSISQRSMDLLIPTIRKIGSELWFTWNPKNTDDAVELLFEDNPKAVLAHVNYIDNPFCPPEMIELAEETRQKDFEKYKHVWLGHTWSNSESSIFGSRVKVREFDIDSLGLPFHGVDWGFAKDPTAGLEVYTHDNRIYIARAAAKVGLTVRDTAGWLKAKLPLVLNHKVYADSNWPQTVDHVKQEIPMLEAVKKWPNSVEEGVNFILGFDEIIVHTDVDDSVADELRAYSYVIDKRTDEVTNVIEDANNHYADALRYALSKLILKKKGTKISFLD